MISGTENKRKTIIAGALGVLALLLVVFKLLPLFVGGDSSVAPPPSTASSSASEPLAQTPAQSRPATTRTANRGRVGHLPTVNTLDPTIRLDLLNIADQQHYKGSGRNIFEAHAPAPPRPKTTTAYAPPPPPPAQPAYVPPPINLKFYGWASKSGQQKKVFLSQGDQIFIAGEGDVVANRYKVVQIGPSGVQIEDILNNNTQSIPMS